MCYAARQGQGGLGGRGRARLLVTSSRVARSNVKYRNTGRAKLCEAVEDVVETSATSHIPQNKEGRHTEISVCLPTTLCTNNKLKNLCLLHRAQATGANRNGLGIATDGNLNLADVGLPTSLRFTVGVGNVLAEYNALTADTALCHS